MHIMQNMFNGFFHLCPYSIMILFSFPLPHPLDDGLIMMVE